MIKSINKPLSVILVICSALLMGVLSWTLPAQERVATPEGEKKLALENLVKQAIQNQKSADVVQQARANPGAIQPALLAAAGSTVAGSPCPSVRISIENGDLLEFINMIANELQISPIIIDPEIRGTVNIISSASMCRDDIFPLFTLVLKNNNAAIIKNDKGFYQIVPTSSIIKRGGVRFVEQWPEPTSGTEPKTGTTPEGKTPGSATPGATISGASTSGTTTTGSTLVLSIPSKKNMADNPPLDKSGILVPVTYIIRAEFVPVTDLIDPIKLFMTDGGVIMSYPRLNMLIVTDYADSATRILQVIRMLDNNFLDPDLIELVKVTNNVPSDIIDDLKKFYGSGTGTSSNTGASFIGLDRLNAILVMASSKRALNDIKYWIDKLDATSARTIQTHFYTVQNSTASNIAMMLAALFSDNTNNNATQGRANAGTAGGGGTTTGTTRTGTGTQSVFGNQVGGVSTGIGGTSGFGGNSGFGGTSGFGGNSGFGNSMGSNIGSRTGGTGALGPTLNVNPTISSLTMTGGSFSGLQDTVRLVVDDINNNLVIQSTAADYAYVYEIIKKMDILPRQVQIDARVFEVDLTNDLQYGINPIFEPNGSTTSPSGAAITDANRSTNFELNSGGSGSLVAGTFLRAGNSREIIMKLSALRTKTKIKVLNSPSVLALDGSTATVNVGKEIPYPAGGFVTNGGSSTNISYRSTGVTLMVYPRVSASGFVTMTITQEVSQPGPVITVGDNQSATSFFVTTVSSTFVVKDGETVAIAGLISESKTNTRQGIPVLSEIPLIGSLFGQTIKNLTRSELVVLITPHVIRTADRLSEMTQELKDLLPNVRRAVDEFELQRIQEMENARNERYRQEQKEMKPPKPVSKATPTEEEKPAASEQSEEVKKTEAPPRTEEPLKPEEPKKLESAPQTEAPAKPDEMKKPS